MFFVLDKKMIVDEKAINFSTEDPPNVSIPDALGPIAYEFLPNYLYLLKNMKNLLAIFQTVDVFKEIAILNKDFFKNGHRFCEEVWLNLKNFLIIVGKNDLEHNLKKKICKNIFDFIKEVNIFEKDEFKSPCCMKIKEEILNEFEFFESKLRLEKLF